MRQAARRVWVLEGDDTVDRPIVSASLALLGTHAHLTLVTPRNRTSMHQLLLAGSQVPEVLVFGARHVEEPSPLLVALARDPRTRRVLLLARPDPASITRAAALCVVDDLVIVGGDTDQAHARVASLLPPSTRRRVGRASDSSGEGHPR
jgi:hypothetical protein